MWKKIALAGGTIALIGGIGTAALAASGSPSSSPSGSASSSAPQAAGGKHLKARALDRMKNFEHGTWVTNGKNNTTVTHTAFHGQVTAISSTSITVKAKDNTSQTFTVNADTKVHTRAQHKGAPITAVENGDTVFVAGTGTAPVTAKQVLDTSR